MKANIAKWVPGVLLCLCVFMTAREGRTSEMQISEQKTATLINEMWQAAPGRESTIIRSLRDIIAVPNLSPAFVRGDAWLPETETMVALLVSSVEALKKEWAGRCRTDDITLRVYGGKDAPVGGKLLTPVLLVEVPAFAGAGAAPARKDSVLLYGHMDKQPPGTGWQPDLPPYNAVIKDEKMYGRGGADDGWALFGALSPLFALRAQNIPHARCVILIESAEESSSRDLPYYMDTLRAELGDLSLIVCLDSGAGDYKRLWLTSSLRGLLNGVLRVDVLEEGMHSGDASGVVPEPFRILRMLLSRLEDENTGVLRLPELSIPLSPSQNRQAEEVAAVSGKRLYSRFPFVDNATRPMDSNLAQLVLNRSLRPTLTVTGMEGLPLPAQAGNVLQPSVQAKLSLRLPPGVSTEKAAAAVKTLLESDPPYNARVSFNFIGGMSGWAAPESAPWLKRAVDNASRAYFGEKVLFLGEGGSIGFMNILSEKYPKAQFVVTGVLGPGANAHGPNEALDLPTARRIAMCVAHILAAHRAADMW